MASWLVHLTPEQAVWVPALAWDIVLCSWATHTLLSQCLSPPRCIKEYGRKLLGKPNKLQEVTTETGISSSSYEPVFAPRLHSHFHMDLDTNHRKI